MSDWKIVLAHAVVMGVLSSLVAVFATGRKRRGALGDRPLPCLLVGFAVIVTTLVIDYNAKTHADATIRHAFDDLIIEGENQVRATLHAHSLDIADELNDIGTATTARKLADLADTFGLDVLTLADTNGIVLVTTDAAHRPGRPIAANAAEREAYRALGAGKIAYVNRRFERWQAPGPEEWMKYFACPLADGRGILQIGVTWTAFEKEFPKYFFPVLDGRPVGDTGFFVVFDAAGRAVLPINGRPETLGRTLVEAGFSEYDLSCPPGKVFHVPLLGEWCRCMAYEPMDGYRMFAVLPLGETRGDALMMSLLVALVLVAVSVGFRLVLVRFQQAQAKIDSLRAQKEERRAADLALARAIQRAELRTDGTEGPGYRLCARMDAAREVGGDFYDYFTLPDGRLVLVMADVSGKGIPAAFFMMKARTTIKSCVYEFPTLAEAVATANVRLAQNNPAEMFVTAWVGVWSPETGELEFVSAGHNPPLVRRAALGVEWLKAPRAMALGVFEEARYRSARTRLAPGEWLFLYTDGVTEAMNAAGELFGERRLEAVLAESGEALVPEVLAAVRNFAAGAEQSDDITMLAFYPLAGHKAS